MKCVTTFSPKGYEEYAGRFLETYVRHVPIPLLAYVEKTPPFTHKLIEYRDIYGHPDISSFINYAQHKERGTPKQNYLYHAAKFCHKVYAQLSVLEKTLAEEVFWWDADTVFFADVSPWELKGYLKGACLAYLGRTLYTETGFIGFDTGHPQFPMFLSHYKDMYYKRKIFNLQHWTDCHAFDEARRGFVGTDIGRGHGVAHVWCESPLAKFSDHLKGGRKAMGASPEHRNYEQILTAHKTGRTAAAEANP